MSDPEASKVDVPSDVDLPSSATTPALGPQGDSGGLLSSSWARGAFVLTLLYIFLAGVSGLEAGIKGLGSGFQDGLLESVTNPVAGLFAGVLATVLVQSSSVSTSTIVGLVGAGTLTVEAAVPMIMGANIGTTVTNTLASLGHIRRGEEFNRAFAAATMHDFFNVMAVGVFLPLELATGVLSSTATRLAEVATDLGIQGGKTSSPIKTVVKWPVEQLQSLFESLDLSSTLTALLLLGLGLGAIFTALTFITKTMRLLIAGRVEQAMNNLLGRGGGLVAMGLGLVITIAVQSSSITTSILVPMVAAGVLTLNIAYPITLGANVGTTVTALLASLAVDLQAGLIVALTHTLFNIGGILALYTVPGVRYIPVRLAEGLAEMAQRNRSVVMGYVMGLFLVVPLVGILVLR